MNELRRLRAAADRLDAAGAPYALATLVRIDGSAYRRPGARVLVAPDGTTTGMISGGCLEREIAHHALRVLASGTPEVVAFAAPRGEDPFGSGAGCGGTVHVLLQRVRPVPGVRALDLLARGEACGRPHALATVFRAHDALADERGQHLLVCPGEPPRGDVAHAGLREALTAACAQVLAAERTRRVAVPLAAGEVEALVESRLPPVRLAVFGTGPDADALVRQGAAVGWHVTVVGTRTADELRDAFPAADRWVPLVHAHEVHPRLRPDRRTAAVLATHGYARDRALVERLLDSSVPYIGVIGSRRRFRDLLRDLAPEPAARRRLFGPAGLDLGAETPEEIALAVVAEAHAVLAGRSARPLRHRRARRGAP